RFYREDRHCVVEGASFTLHSGSYRSGIAGRTDHQSHHPLHPILVKTNVEHGASLFTKAEIFCVSHYADDFQYGPVVVSYETWPHEASPERIFTAEESMGHAFIDNGHTLRLPGVLGHEVATGE